MTARDIRPSVALGRRVVPANARVIAGRLAGLFATDQQIVRQLADAQRRLRTANDRLSDGLLLDPCAVHWQIHGAFCDYQHAAEQRRQLAVDVGELAAQLTDALCAAGWSIEQATAANVHHLATAADDHASTRSEQ